MDIVTNGRWEQEGRLWIENGAGAARAHRVLPSSKPYNATVGGRRRRVVLVRKVDCIADGHFPVLLSELTAAAPLSADERDEYDRLDAELAGTVGDAGKLLRFNALRLRSLEFGEVAA